EPLGAAGLAALSNVLGTDVFAFENDNEYGLRIALARAGAMIRDRYECEAEGIVHEEGAALSGEPQALSAETVVGFAEAVTIDATVELGLEVWLVGDLPPP